MTGRPDNGTDLRLADALRRALVRSAMDVQPGGDGLTKIRARTAARRQRWLVPLAATTAAVVVGGGVAWAAGTLDGDGELPIADAPPISAPMTSPPITSPSPSETAPETTEPLAAAVATVPIYYLGAQRTDTGDAYLLFREFRRVGVADADDREQRVQAALTEMLADAPLDEDYVGRWPAAAAVVGVEVDIEAGAVTVDLTGLDWSDDDTAPDGPPIAELGSVVVQQLVFTATGAASTGGSPDEAVAITDVRLLVDGEAVEEVLGVDTSGPLRRDAQDVQASIWILSPEQGATVGAPVVVKIYANLPAGGPPQYELARDGVIVASGQTDAFFAFDRWVEVEFTIEDVQPGTYDLTVFDAGSTGDRDLSPYDSKTFTVG